MSSRPMRPIPAMALVISLAALALSVYVLTAPRRAERGLDEVRAALSQSERQTAEELAALASAAAERADGLGGRLDALATERLEERTALDERLLGLENAVDALRRGSSEEDAIAELLSMASGDAVEEGTFSVLQSGVLVGTETFALYPASDGYVLRLSGSSNRSDAPVEFAAAVRTDGTYRVGAYALRGETPRGAIHVAARTEGDRMNVSIVDPDRTADEALSVGGGAALLDDAACGLAVLLYRALESGTLEGWTAVDPRRGAATGMAWKDEETVTLAAADARVAAQRWEVTLDDGRTAALCVADGRVVGVEWVQSGLFAYRSDVFPDGFLVERRSIRDLALPMGVVENQLPIVNGSTKLGGTLTYPMSGGESLPIILLLPDLGRFDRNGNAPGMQTGLLKELARGLSQIGVATYRFDGRTSAAAGEASGPVALRDVLSDARIALYMLRALPFADRAKIYVFGQGIGGTIAALLVSQGAAAGLITCGAPAHPYDVMTVDELRRRATADGVPDDRADVLVDQERAFLQFVENSTGTWSDLSDEEIRAALPWMGEEERARRRETIPLELFRDLLAVDPLDALRKIAGPTLILQGDKDFQVPVADGGLLSRTLVEAGNEKCTLAVLLDVNHAGRHHAEAADSRDLHLDRALDGQLLGVIAEWLSADLGLPGGSGSPASQT